jgi:hypothetical protein
MPDSPIFDLSMLPDQPPPTAFDLSLLPDKPDPALQVAPEFARSQDSGDREQSADPSTIFNKQQRLEQFENGISHPENRRFLPAGQTPCDAVIRAPHENDDDNLIQNATSDDESISATFGKTLINALKRLYSPDTTSPKALAAAQNAIAIYQATGISPVLTLDNPDVVNQALFGTGHAREEFLMNLIGMFGLGAFSEAGSAAAALPGLTRYRRAADAAGEAWKLREVEGSLLPATESIYKNWRIPLGLAGMTAEEEANALIRSYLEGRPFSQTKPYGLRDVLPPQESEGAKTVVDLLDMFGKYKAMSAGFGGLQTLWEAMAYDRISQIVPSRSLYIPAEAIRNHFGASVEGSGGEYYDILQNLQKQGMLSKGQIGDAIKYGLDVELPLSRVVGVMDAPWFARIKDFLNISPYKEVYEVPAGKPEARLRVSGQLEAPRELQGVAANPREETAITHSEKSSPPASVSEKSLPAALSGEATSSSDILAPLINEASEKYDVPANIITAVVWKASNYNPDIAYGTRLGSSEDSGKMQPVAKTAGALEIGGTFDPAQVIDENAKYLRALYDRFGDWGKAVAAYNSGEANRLFADHPEASVTDAPNYSGYVNPVLDTAAKFAQVSTPEPGARPAVSWGRGEGVAPKDWHGDFVASTQEPVGERHNVYAEMTETPEFKKWFGDSKVVFKEGEFDYFQNPEGIHGVPRMVYHGTGAENNFEIFHTKGGAIWFRSDNVGYERLAFVPAYLKIKNPLEAKLSDNITMGAAIIKAKANGNDGVILDHENRVYRYAVFSPDQIGSPLVGDEFFPGKPDVMREQERSSAEGPQVAQPGAMRSVFAVPSDTTIGKAFRDIEKKPVNIIGLSVRSYVDMAVLAQGWRNPYYEELRYVFIKDGIIVDHEGVTCKHPACTGYYLDDFDEYIEHLLERIRVLGATDIYIVHNHPSGNPEPSIGDYSVTNDIALYIPQCRGHIIINSKKYGYINAVSSRGVIKRLPNIPRGWIDPILQPSIPHELLGRESDTIDHIAAWVKSLTIDRDMPLLVYIDTYLTVRGLQEVHPQNFTNLKLMSDRMPEKLADFGSIGAVAVLPEKISGFMIEAARFYVAAHVLRNVVWAHGNRPLCFGEYIPDRNYFGGRLSKALPGQRIR